jgi:membrane protein required for colicin V production
MNIDQLSSIEWIDWTAIALLGVFFLLGLFKGFVWQVSRIVSLIAAWFLAGHYGVKGSELIDGWAGPSTSHPDLHLFLAYVVIFVLVVVVLSLVAWGLQKLVKETGLTFYDRVGGAVLGLGTGALGVVILLAGMYMFMPANFKIVAAAQRSQSMKFSQKALGLLGDRVPEPMRRVFSLSGEPSAPGEPGAPGEKSPEEGPGKGR